MLRAEHGISRYYSTRRAQLQTTKQTLTTASKYSIEFTYSDFPCHLTVSRDKHVLINRGWKSDKKGGKGWPLPLVLDSSLMTISLALFPQLPRLWSEIGKSGPRLKPIRLQDWYIDTTYQNV